MTPQWKFKLIYSIYIQIMRRHHSAPDATLLLLLQPSRTGTWTIHIKVIVQVCGFIASRPRLYFILKLYVYQYYSLHFMFVYILSGNCDVLLVINSNSKFKIQKEGKYIYIHKAWITVIVNILNSRLVFSCCCCCCLLLLFTILSILKYITGYYLFL